MDEKKTKPALRFAGFDDDWEQRKLGECICDAGERTSDFSAYPLYSLTIENGVTPKTQRYERGFLVTKEDDLFKIVNPGNFVTNPMNLRFGAVGYNKEVHSVSVSGYYDVFEIDDNQCSSFWNSYFRTPIGLQRFDDAATGSLIEKRRVHYSELKKIEFMIPYLISERIKIGEFFELLDHLITLHQRKLDKMKNFKKAMLEKMFPKKDEKIPEVRFAGFTDDWEQRKVGDFYDFKNGLNKGKAFFGAGTPIVNFTDVFHKRGLRVSELRGKVTLTSDEIFNYEVLRGDIFFTRTSETIEEIGYPSVMLESPKDTVFSGFVLRGRAFGADPLALRFKQYAFITEAFRTEMIKKSSMTTRALTSGTAIKRMYFQYPKSLEEQNCISAFFDALDHLITLHQRQLEKLKNIKKSMLEKMFV